MIGKIFDIKEFTIHDGPGIRTTVFLKGCPLRCEWCHNPEGLEIRRQLIINKNLCKDCGRCKAPCNHKECKSYERCLLACPDGLISLCGETIETKDLAKRLIANVDYLKQNGGGITFSGGEPLMQAEFVIDVIKYLDVQTAIQTCGYAEKEVFERVIDKIDYVMMDIKIADREIHKKYTGVYNDLILENFDYLRNSGKNYVVRTPMIPNITDTDDNLSLIKNIIRDSKWEKLPYNCFAGAKYKML